MISHLWLVVYIRFKFDPERSRKFRHNNCISLYQDKSFTRGYGFRGYCIPIKHKNRHQPKETVRGNGPGSHNCYTYGHLSQGSQEKTTTDKNFSTISHHDN